MPVVQKKLVYPELSYKVMSVVFEVHNQLGPGYTENIYEESLACELRNQAIPFDRQRVIEVQYKGQPVGTYRLDFVVDEKIVLEIKAVSDLNDVFKQQVLAYLHATHLQLGLLINFGTKKVQSVRIVN